MRMPKLLQEGDLVAITAASGPCDPDKLESGVRILEEMGLRVQVMESCLTRNGYLAATDAIRLRDLHMAFADREIRGIFMARGGYGAGRLLSRLDLRLVMRNPKVIVGFSDTTALHIVFNQVCRMITFHGPMPAAGFSLNGNEEADKATLESLRKIIFAKGCGVQQTSDSLTTLVSGTTSGIITGGNLSLLAASLGTPYEIKTRGRILFMEETQEAPYRVDRLFLQLKQAGKLREARGFLLGDFSPETQESLHQALEDLIIPECKPTLWGLPCGHTSPNITLPLGCTAYISTESAYPLQIYDHSQNGGGHIQPWLLLPRKENRTD